MTGTPQATLWRVSRANPVAFIGPDIYFELDAATGFVGIATDVADRNLYPVRLNGFMGLQGYATSTSGPTSRIEHQNDVLAVDVLDVSDTPFPYAGAFWKEETDRVVPHDDPTVEDVYWEGVSGTDRVRPNDTDPGTHWSGVRHDTTKPRLVIWQRGA